MEQISVTVLDYNEFDQLVHTHFPERDDYSYLIEEEADNDSEHLVKSVGVPSRHLSPEDLEKERLSDLEDFERWLKREDLSFVGQKQILEALYRKGVIPPGNYLIEVCW